MYDVKLQTSVLLLGPPGEMRVASKWCPLGESVTQAVWRSESRGLGVLTVAFRNFQDWETFC